MSPTHIHSLCIEFEMHIKEIFEKCISNNIKFFLPDKAHEQAQLSAEHGGFNLGNTQDVMTSACIASFIETKSELSTIIPNINEEISKENTTINMFKDLQQSIQKLVQINNEVDVFQITSSANKTIQSKILKYFKDERHKQFKTLLHNPKDIAFYSALTANPLTWLSVIPNGNYDKLNNTQFQIITLMLLALPQLVLSNNLRCDCGTHNILNSSFGALHLGHDCKNGGAAIHKHNNLAMEFCKILNHYGIHAINAPKISMYQAVMPNSRMQTDAIIPNPNPWSIEKTVYIDFTIANPLVHPNITNNNATTCHERLAEAKKLSKINKYNRFHQDPLMKDIKCVPFVIVLPGYIEKETNNFLNTLIDYIAIQQDIPKSNIKSFIYRKLTFSIMKSLADGIISNNCRILNKNSNPSRYIEYDKYNIIESTNSYNTHSQNWNFNKDKSINLQDPNLVTSRNVTVFSNIPNQSITSRSVTRIPSNSSHIARSSHRQVARIAHNMVLTYNTNSHHLQE
jgi:hypothetical protein